MKNVCFYMVQIINTNIVFKQFNRETSQKNIKCSSYYNCILYFFVSYVYKTFDIISFFIIIDYIFFVPI